MQLAYHLCNHDENNKDNGYCGFYKDYFGKTQQSFQDTAKQLCSEKKYFDQDETNEYIKYLFENGTPERETLIGLLIDLGMERIHENEEIWKALANIYKIRTLFPNSELSVSIENTPNVFQVP